MAISDVHLSSVKCVGALFLQTTFVLGTIKSIGVYLPELKKTLNLTPTDVGVGLGLFNGFAFGPGPMIAYLYQTRKGGYRRLLVTTGSVLAPGGLIMASQVTGKIGFSLCLAASGLGSNILSVSLVIALNDQHSGIFGILYGVGKSGYAFGMALVPLAAAYLMEIYGWSGSLIIIGGIMAHLIPLTLMVDTKGKRSDEYIETDINSQGDRHNGIDVLEDNEKGIAPRKDSKNEIHKSKSAYGDEILLANELDLRYEESETTQRNCALENENIASYFICCKSLWSHLKKSVYNRDRWLILLMLITFEFAMMDAGWHAFLIPRAVERGWSDRKALNIAYSGAVAAFIGRCFGAVILRLQLLSGLSWFLLLTLLNVSSLITDILVPNFSLVIVTSFITSLTIAERNILVLVICKDRVSHSEFPIILATSEVVFGIGAFIGVSLSGFFGDLYHTFNASFIFIAAVDAIVFCFTTPLLICNRPVEDNGYDDENH